MSEHDNDVVIEEPDSTIYQPTEPRLQPDFGKAYQTGQGVTWQPEPRPKDEGPLSSLNDEQRVRVAALNMAKPLLSNKGLMGTNTPPELDDLLKLAAWILDGQTEALYPFQSGDTLVLGPEIFVAIDGSTICWKGTNYEKQEEDRG